MTLIEFLGCPAAFALVLFLVLTPFVGTDNASAIGMAGAFFWVVFGWGSLHLMGILFWRPPKCTCGRSLLFESSRQQQATQWRCSSCDAVYWMADYPQDGWKRCSRVAPDGEHRPWRKRRRWSRWKSDSEE